MVGLWKVKGGIHMRTSVVGILASVLLMGMFVGGIAGADDIRSRMKARLPVIKALKTQGIVGENNQGYVKVLGDNKEKEAIVNAENADRKAVYRAIAKQQGTTAEAVEKRRALQIAQRATAGEWIQDESGKWIQKP
jgi:uncharacterized protein YdbL (DUF1318 family)